MGAREHDSAGQDGEPAEAELTVAEIAGGAGVSVGTVRRWVTEGLVPGFEGRWTESVRAWVRVIARLRERGHSLEAIRGAIEEGRIVSGRSRPCCGRHRVVTASPRLRAPPDWTARPCAS